jgi:hypothetical protein
MRWIRGDQAQNAMIGKLIESLKTTSTAAQ